MLQRSRMVKHLALRVDHASEQPVAQRQAQHADGKRGHLGVAQLRRRHVGLRRGHARAAGQAVDVARRHEKSAPIRKPHHLGQHRLLARHLHLALRAHGHAQPGGLEHQPGEAAQGATRLQRQRLGHARTRMAKELAPDGIAVDGAIGRRMRFRHVFGLQPLLGKR